MIIRNASPHHAIENITDRGKLILKSLVDWTFIHPKLILLSIILVNKLFYVVLRETSPSPPSLIFAMGIMREMEFFPCLQLCLFYLFSILIINIIQQNNNNSANCITIQGIKDNRLFFFFSLASV